MGDSFWVPRLDLSRTALTVHAYQMVRCLFLGELSVVLDPHSLWYTVDPTRIWVPGQILRIPTVTPVHGVGSGSAPCAWSNGPLVLISFEISGICVVDIR
jgi:hypothetical protein